MSKMPRWSDGYGFQVIQEYRHERDLLQGDFAIGKGFTEDVHILNLEAVYTWERWIRLTAKLPYILHAQRDVFDKNNNRITQTDKGFGDLTLALPLKKYFNLDARSGSWTLAPQLRIPLASQDEYSIGDGVWGAGLSVGYETETRNWFLGLGANAWTFESREPFEVGAFFDVGINLFAFNTSGQLTWENDFRWEDDGSYQLQGGLALYWKFTDTIHFRSEWKHDFLDYRGIIDHGNGETVKIGLGFVY